MKLRYILGGITPIMLIGIGIFFLFYLKFFFILKPRKVFSSLFKKEKGEGVSGFGALTVALAGTLGVGNIVGVCGALIVGGAGSIFWMLLSAFAAMVLKYAEILLAHMHRKSCGIFMCGGAMYYIEDILCGRLGRFIGCIFALFCLLNSLSMGCMLQANAVSSAFFEMSGLSPVFVGAVLVLLSGIVIFRGVHDISPLTCVIIPIMTLLYVAISLVVIIKFRSNLPGVIGIIMRDAFSFESAGGGIVGFLASSQIRYGVMRGLLSNEAGCGTAPMAHSSSAVKSCAKQGVWGIIEVFVDTVLLCTLTALSVLCAFNGNIEHFAVGDEMKLLIAAYGSAIAGSAASIMTAMLFFFAFATIICWAYYGNLTLSYLTESKNVSVLYKILYVFCIFLGACYIENAVWTLSDIALGAMTFINLIILFIAHKEIKKETVIFLK